MYLIHPFILVLSHPEALMMHSKAVPSDWRAMCGLSVCIIYSWVADLMASDDPDASPLYHGRNDYWIPSDEKKMRIRAEIYENVRALELNLGTLSHCSSRIDQWGQWGFTNWGVRLFICGGDRAQGG